jgi:hypothetical protein
LVKNFYMGVHETKGDAIMKEHFVTINFQNKTHKVISRTQAILREYSEQGFTLTLRQLFYQFVARGLTPNTPQKYKNLGNTLVNVRRAGLVDWGAIEDRTRDLESFSFWDSPAARLRAAANTHREDIWLGQKYRPEIWIEKAALAGVIEPVCGRWRVPSFPARGYPSHSELYSAGKRFQGYLQAGQEPVVFYMGDHDPSGLDMDRNLREHLSLYARRPIQIIRLGLTLDQVRELNLPPNTAKEEDKRYPAYVAETHETDSWELDALSPAYIDDLLEDAIEGVVDMGVWNSALAKESVGRVGLERLAESAFPAP